MHASLLALAFGDKRCRSATSATLRTAPLPSNSENIRCLHEVELANMTQLPRSPMAPHSSRRAVLRGATLATGVALLPACAAARTAAQSAPAAGSGGSASFAFDDPRANVRAMARFAGDLDPAKQGRVHYSGRAFAVVPGQPVRPIYGIEGIGSTRIEAIADGGYRFLFSEFAIYTDLETGLPLTQWTNPVTNEVVPVWHQRNGPINFALRPDMNAFGAFDAVDAAPAFKLPWVSEGELASFALDVTSQRKNPLDPATWPLESSGETMFLSEHSQYFVDRVALANEALTSLPFHAALQSQKPWHPWMMMGQRDGYVFTRMIANKVDGLDALPAPVAAFARENMAEWTQAPLEWTGAYASAHSIYAKTMSPRQ